MARLVSSRGFSLVELLLASVCLAVAATVLASGLLMATRGDSYARSQVLLSQAMASQLAMLDEEIGAADPGEGHMAPPWDAYTWTLQMHDGPIAPLREVALTVTRDGQTAHASTYLLSHE